MDLLSSELTEDISFLLPFLLSSLSFSPVFDFVPNATSEFPLGAALIACYPCRFPDPFCSIVQMRSRIWIR